MKKVLNNNLQCDFCDKDITNDVFFELSVYEQMRDEEISEQDMCLECKLKIEKLIEQFSEYSEDIVEGG